jgi:hypothetical protein
MITDEELAQLPEDPELAFVEFERIMRARLYEAEDEVSREQFGDADTYRLEYMNKVLAAAKEYGIETLVQWQVPSANARIFEQYRQFVSDVDHFTTQIRIRHAPKNRRNSVGLDGNTKRKIHHHIDQIRSAIDQAELPDGKRESLYEKLGRFALEVDKARTGLVAGMAVYIAVCDGIGQGFKKLEPARHWIDSIAGLLGRAKEVEDSLRPTLSRPIDRKRLEPPRNRPPVSPPRGADLDDDIPF